MGVLVFLALTLVVLTEDLVAKEKCKAEHSCKLEDMGCFNDHYARALPEEILNERDKTSKVFGGRTIDWKHFETYLEGFACRCAKIASKKGYTVIGLQFYGECWSGPTAHETYNKYGKSDKCVDGDFLLMSDSKKKNSSCNRYSGTSWTNHVYRIATPGCTRHQIEPIGCFHDDLVPPRPVPNYVMTERDYRHKGWNGRLIDWANWKTYSPEMICRCADAASKRGDDYFSIQFWGECWSGKEVEVKYKRNGGSDSCANEYFQLCQCNGYNCVGKAYTNYVYRLHYKENCKS